MGQKVSPISFRLGITRTWESRWFAKKDYSKLLHEDLKIRKFVKERLKNAGVSKVEVERYGDKIKVNIFTARPGIIIGKRGVEVDKLKQDIQSIVGNSQLFINIIEIKRPERDAQLIAEGIALQLIKRVAFRRTMKKSVLMAIKAGAQGIKISCSGRLAGAEIARQEWYREGRVPLHTIRADIDYGFAEAYTTYGVIGVKVTIFKGEVLPAKNKVE